MAGEVKRQGRWSSWATVSCPRRTPPLPIATEPPQRVAATRQRPSFMLSVATCAVYRFVQARSRGGHREGGAVDYHLTFKQSPALCRVLGLCPRVLSQGELSGLLVRVRSRSSPAGPIRRLCWYSRFCYFFRCALIFEEEGSVFFASSSRYDTYGLPYQVAQPAVEKSEPSRGVLAAHWKPSCP